MCVFVDFILVLLMFRATWISPFWRVIGPIDFDYFQVCDFRLILWFFIDFHVFRCSDEVLFWSSLGFQSKSRQSQIDVLEAWFWTLAKDQNHEISWLQFSFIFLANINSFGGIFMFSGALTRCFFDSRWAFKVKVGSHESTSWRHDFGCSPRTKDMKCLDFNCH